MRAIVYTFGYEDETVEAGILFENPCGGCEEVVLS
jgi:hypothetical protein